MLRFLRVLLPLCMLAALGTIAGAAPTPAYLDTSLPAEERARDLVSRMTLDEKVAQLQSDAPAIARLHVAAYNWWSEGLHGVARAGFATVYPQAIGLAATWDPALVHTIGEAISLEARVKYEESMRKNGAALNYYGLTEFSPNINIFRDPRWGRGQETYGEDPYLTAQMGVAFVTGMQGGDPRYFRVIATAKHFAAHSGPEKDRSGFDARITPYDFTDTYLPQFEQVVRRGHVDSVMTSYNAINGVPVSADKPLLEMVRNRWGFRGYFVSDCDAVDVIYSYHHYAKSLEEAAADALRAGVDLDCGNTYGHLSEAAKDGLVTQGEIDAAATRLFGARMRLGMFDPPSRVPFARVAGSAVDSPAHHALALRAAAESLVLLRNDGNVLPLRARRIHSLAVIGPTAENEDVLVGNYGGTPSHPVTILSGILDRARSAGITVAFAPGGLFAQTSGAYVPQTDAAYIEQAVQTARRADVVVLALGNTPYLEGEEGIGDRSSLGLPDSQETLARAVVATGKPVVLVLTGGSALAVDWESAHVPAILYAWYPGQSGGTAVADALFGDIDPSGRLPITIYRSVAQLPPFTDYDMRGRTYRYFTGRPLYPFGYGLSYTRFRYDGLRVVESHPQAGKPLRVRVRVTNGGSRGGDDVVQLYVAFASTPFAAPHPVRALGGFERVSLPRGATKTLTFTVDPRSLSLVDAKGARFCVPGAVEIAVGSSQPNAGTGYASNWDGVTAHVSIGGPMRELAP
ncbi:MAG: glycoside hydrolase family 3 C-terminal domain-containing protein [Vulcanimicrobiaceae bacterium]